MARYFEVTLKRSYNGRTDSVIGTLKGMGLKHPGKKVFLKDTPAVRGMIYKVVDMVAVTPKDGTIPPSKRELTRQFKAKGGKAKAKPAKAQASA
jgi:large subunit ribosomal protein L30